MSQPSALEVLYTTRAMRRVKPDPIPLHVQQQIIDAAIRAPSGGNQQGWQFLLIDSPVVRNKLAPIYRECMALIWTQVYGKLIEEHKKTPESPDAIQFFKVQRSAQYMADHFETYPLLLVGFSARTSGSIEPALWNAQLAARVHGVGSTLTGALAFRKEQTLEVLGVPADSPWQMVGLVAFGYPTGRWAVAPRRAAHEVTYYNQWNEPLPYAIAQPLWPEA